MPRKLRIQYPGAIYHVMNRGDRREAMSRATGSNQTGNGVKPYICDSDLTFWLGLAKPLASCRAKCECNIPAPCIT